MLYKLLGMLVWRAARWYLARTWRTSPVGRKLAAGGMVALLVAAVAGAAAKRGSDSD